MGKITFLGAGSTVFAKNLLGDCLLTPSLKEVEIALYDIDPVRLDDSYRMLNILNQTMNKGKASIQAYLGLEQRKEALRDAAFVINAIQVGGYEPSTVIDFEIPKKYGLQQTIGDTLGIGGIFRGLRTIPVLLDISREMEEVCPDACLLNYTNPLAIVTGAVLRGSSVRSVGLCHSVQVCAETLLQELGFEIPAEEVGWKIAGINHMAWLLEITVKGKDLYPEIKRRAASLLAQQEEGKPVHPDTVRLVLMLHFGYYVTESSEHNAEYTPYWIKRDRPELIKKFNIPLDEYPRRCIKQIEEWKRLRTELVENPSLTHLRTKEYASYLIEAVATDRPFRIHGNILNRGLIPNLPPEAVVEVPCLVDRNGVQGCYVDPLPSQCASLNQTNINVQLLTIEAALSQKRDRVYQAAYLDPRCAAELTLKEIRALCDDLIEAHGEMLPPFT